VIARRARTASLLALGALAVHQLRYALAYGGDAGSALASQGHGYLTAVAPTLVSLTAATLAATLILPALTRLAARPERRRPHASAASLFAVALLGTFSVQELVEGALAAGHPSGAAAVLGDGGWLALPLALAIGSLCAAASLFLEHAERVLVAPPRKLRARVLRPALLPATPIAGPARAPLVSAPLAFGLARRGPPPLRPHA
jgi:hypothetical protein